MTMTKHLKWKVAIQPLFDYMLEHKTHKRRK